MPVQLTILGSGSGGNCAYLETDQTRILIDAGMSAKQIRQRLESLGKSLEQVQGILLTHEHGDHCSGLAVIGTRCSIPVYCNRFTYEATVDQLGKSFSNKIFTTGATFEIGDIIVETFSVPHDAQDPVGFCLRTTSGRIGFITDLGHVTKMVVERLRLAKVLVLEANHDVQMLQQDTRRPWSLKQRILSRHGHLSNEAAAAAAEQMVSEEMRHLILGHLSQDCNHPDLAARVVQERLQRIGATRVSLIAARQDQPSPTLLI